MTWLVVDLEVQNHKWFGSVASPHNPDNYIVAPGWCIDNGPVEHKYFNTKEESLSSDWLEKALEGQSVLVAHNLTFELHWLFKCYPKTIIDFINRGGKFYCTQYAEFLLSNHTHQYPSLEDCSVKYRDMGVDEHEVRKIDEVKILWETGVLTADIDKALLLDYLCHPMHGDIANTRRVCFKQVSLLRSRGMWPVFNIRMDSLLFNAVATFNGLYVNQPIAQKNLQAQLKEMDSIREGILALLPKDLPEELEFSFTSGYHMSAFLFGGSIKYRKKVSYDPVKFVKVAAHEYKSSDTAKPVQYVPVGHASICTLDYEVTRYKSGKNKGEPKIFQIESEQELLKWGEVEYKFKGLIDLIALPKHVGEQYLGKRAEFKGKRELCCGTPVYSTSSDSLDVLANFTEVAKPIKELATLQKDTGTYYLMEDSKGKVSGMLQFLEPDSIIHHQLNNCSTITARLSSSKPNFQTLPRADQDDDGNLKSRVKEMFTSRFGQNGRIVEVDYSALEVVALATISGDTNLMRMLNEGIDMHCYRLAAKLKEDYDSVKLKCKDQSHPENAKYSVMRTEIKPRAFA